MKQESEKPEGFTSAEDRYIERVNEAERNMPGLPVPEPRITDDPKHAAQLARLRIPHKLVTTEELRQIGGEPEK